MQFSYSISLRKGQEEDVRVSDESMCSDDDAGGRLAPRQMEGGAVPAPKLFGPLILSAIGF
jgi:hypothetical protein